MKILVTNPPAYFGKDNHRHFIQAGSRWSFSIDVPRDEKDHYLPYPFGLGHVTSILKSTGEFEVKGLDACARDYDDTDYLDDIKKYSPDVIFVDIPTISFPLTMPLLKEIKQSTGCKIILGGGHVTALTNEVMQDNDFVDYAVLGEYELAIKPILDHERGKISREKLAEINGLSMRMQSGNLMKPPIWEKYNLDEMPIPDRDDFPIHMYHDFEVVGAPCAQMLSSRGCPYNCSFCMPIRVMFGDSPFYRKRSPQNIIDEMRMLKDKYGAKQVYFDDDTFAVDRQRLKKLCEMMKEQNLDLPWSAMGDITLDRTTLEILSRSGCVGIKFGVETASTATLDKISKNFVTIEKVRDFARNCRDTGIWTHATYIIGLPGDTADDIRKTIEFSKNLNTDSLQYSIATPFPGTPFYEEAKAKGWLVTNDWTRYDGARYSVLDYPHLKHDEIEELHALALKEWYKDALKKELASPKRMIKIMKAGRTKYALRKMMHHLNGKA